MTLILKLHLDTVKMHLYTETEVPSSTVLAWTDSSTDLSEIMPIRMCE